ncbi:MAG: AI-2E family transporter [Desulfohalobiaceae bacterium]|nr:AI-2E family transporter [Desulfohalobiaceae bacterium]
MTSEPGNIFARWYRDYFSDPQIVIFVLLGLLIVSLFLFLGEYLAPIIASLVVAYLLEGFIRPLERMRLPRLAAVCLVFVVFILALVFLVLGLAPMLSSQISQFLQAMPKMLSTWQDQLQTLPQKYPQLITEDQVNRIMGLITDQFTALARNFFSFSLASVRSLLNFVVYLVLVPLMSFFLLKDKARILSFLQGLLPENIDLANQVWQEVNEKIAKFIQGKVWEILIVWVAAYLVFLAFGLQFSVLLGLLVGLSVIVPYVGALLMTIPVALVAFFQWGFEPHFIYILIAYGVLQFLDGNVLVPLLMSEIVNLHPLAIIMGIIIFGGLWGVWGVLFAIPLATLVNAIIKAWLRKSRQSMEEEDLHAG